MSSTDLTITPEISATPSQIQDQEGNTSGLYLTNSATNTVNVNSSGKIVFGILPDGVGEWIQNTSNGTNANWGIAFYGHSAERMRMTYDGNLGIGTTAPTANLHVNGTVLFQLASLPPSGETWPLVVDSNGSVSAVDPDIRKGK